MSGESYHRFGMIDGAFTTLDESLRAIGSEVVAIVERSC